MGGDVGDMQIYHRGKPTMMEFVHGSKVVEPILFTNKLGEVGIGVIPVAGNVAIDGRAVRRIVNPNSDDGYVFLTTPQPYDLIALWRGALVFEHMKEISLELVKPILSAVQRESTPEQKKARKSLRKILGTKAVIQAMNEEVPNRIIQLFLERYTAGDQIRATSIGEELSNNKLDWERYFEIPGIPHPEEGITGVLIEHPTLVEHVHTLEGYAKRFKIPVGTMRMNMICLELIRKKKVKDTGNLPFTTIFTAAAIKAADITYGTGGTQSSRPEIIDSREIAERITMWLANNDTSLSCQYLLAAQAIINN